MGTRVGGIVGMWVAAGLGVGAWLGRVDGLGVGNEVGGSVGKLDGGRVGLAVGLVVGSWVGERACVATPGVGAGREGRWVGERDGIEVREGRWVGTSVGTSVGCRVHSWPRSVASANHFSVRVFCSCSSRAHRWAAFSTTVSLGVGRAVGSGDRVGAGVGSQVFEVGAWVGLGVGSGNGTCVGG